jgi:hypothetical protein
VGGTLTETQRAMANSRNTSAKIEPKKELDEEQSSDEAKQN